MTTRPDIPALWRRLARMEARRDPEALALRAALEWIACCEAQLRAGAEWRQAIVIRGRRGGDGWTIEHHSAPSDE
jgi:hypothetical protein